jgi:hypothetical protein
LIRRFQGVYERNRHRVEFFPCDVADKDGQTSLTRRLGTTNMLEWVHTYHIQTPEWFFVCMHAHEPTLLI